MPTVSALGALIALIVAIFLILKKVSPAYGMLVGALVGGLVGGADLSQTVSLMIGGAQGITTAVMRILAAGVLAGVLIESGAANTIAETITNKLGETRALLALALATLILTAVGVFIDVAVITVSPIALALARRTDLSKPAILLAMIGGGKAGNLMSPNPNAIAAADTFHLPLTSVMMAGIIPAIFGLILTYFLAKRLRNKGSRVSSQEVVAVETQNLPSFLTALCIEIILIDLKSFDECHQSYRLTSQECDPLVSLQPQSYPLIYQYFLCNVLVEHILPQFQPHPMEYYLVVA